MKKLPYYAIVPIGLGLSLGLLAGCHSSTGTQAGASAKARVSSAAANPTVSADVTALEKNITACMQANVSSAHPVKNTMACAFPQGDTAKIQAYAVQQFTPAVLTTHGPGSARDAWAQKVASYALTTQNGGK